MSRRDSLAFGLITLGFVAGLALTGLGLLRTFQAVRERAAGGTFEGIYQYAFETSAFYPGADACRPATWVTAFWLGAGPGSGFFERLNGMVRDAPPEWRYADGVIVQARFTGSLSPPGQYGHLGQYAREVTVERLLDMSFPAACP